MTKQTASKHPSMKRKNQKKLHCSGSDSKKKLIVRTLEKAVLSNIIANNQTDTLTSAPVESTRTENLIYVQILIIII